MTKSDYKFAVTAPKMTEDGFIGGTYIVSRHMTRSAADKAAKGFKGFKVVPLKTFDGLCGFLDRGDN